MTPRVTPNPSKLTLESTFLDRPYLSAFFSKLTFMRNTEFTEGLKMAPNPGGGPQHLPRLPLCRFANALELAF